MGVLGGVVCLLLARSAHAERFPADANRIDLVALGLSTDPNAAAANNTVWNTAMDQCLGKGGVVFIANGTYTFASQIHWKLGSGPNAGKWSSNCQVVGESRDGTILKAVDGATWAQTQPPLGLAFAFMAEGSVLAGQPSGAAGGCGDEGFRNGVRDLTLNTGAGNRWASGLQICASNRGAVRNVAIVSGDPGRLGDKGIWISGSSGPSMIEDVYIYGFDTQIFPSGVANSTTVIRPILDSPLVLGIELTTNPLFIEDLTILNAPLGVRATAPGAFNTIIGATISGSGARAIEWGSAQYLPKGLLRDIATSGFTNALKLQGVLQPGTSITEYASNAPASFNLWPDFPMHTLRLPNPHTPVSFYSDPIANPQDWANARSYGADPTNTNDDTVGIQAALNSGKPIVYLPKSTNNGTGFSEYNISGTLLIPATVKRIHFMENYVRAAAGVGPRLKLDCSSSAEPLTIEGAWFTAPTGTLGTGGFWAETNCLRPVVFKDVSFGGGVSEGLRAHTGPAAVYFDDIVGLSITLEPGGELDARQYNLENEITAINDGGTVRVMGGKSERDFVLFQTKRGGRTEVLGWQSNAGVATGNDRPQGPAFETIDGKMSVSFRAYSPAPPSTNDVYITPIREQRCDEVRTLGEATVLAEGLQFVVSGMNQFFPLLSTGQ